MKHLLIVLTFSFGLMAPFHVKAQESLEQIFVDMLIESSIIAFDNPETRKELSRLSAMLKDEQTYQYIMQRIDKFIIANELEEYKQQAEELKAFITQSRELYIQSEQETLEKYRQLKEQQQQRERERQLREANVIEV